MRLSKSQAALLNAREIRLLTAKGPWQVNELATLIRQVRDLRDKQRDLQKRQDGRLAGSGKGRVGALGVANERTAAKERLLDEALDGFQQELRDIDQESSLACRELLDDAEVPGRRANPKKAAKRTKAASPASANAGKAKAKGGSAGKPAKKAPTKDGKAAGKATRSSAKQSTKQAAGKTVAKRAAAKAPAKERSSKARLTLPKHVAGDASARPSLASRKSRGTRAR